MTNERKNDDGAKREEDEKPKKGRRRGRKGQRELEHEEKVHAAELAHVRFLERESTCRRLGRLVIIAGVVLLAFAIVLGVLAGWSAEKLAAVCGAVTTVTIAALRLVKCLAHPWNADSLVPAVSALLRGEHEKREKGPEPPPPRGGAPP